MARGNHAGDGAKGDGPGGLIDIGEIQQLLDAMVCSDGGGHTRAELRDQWGTSNARTKAVIRHLLDTGRMRIGKRAITDLAGRNTVTHVYIVCGK